MNTNAMCWKSLTRNGIACVEGTCRLFVISSHEPDRVVIARKGNLWVIDIGTGTFFIASDQYRKSQRYKCLIFGE